MSKNSAPVTNKRLLAEAFRPAIKLSGRKALFEEYRTQVERGKLNRPFVALLALREMRFLRQAGLSQKEIETMGSQGMLCELS